MTERSVLAALVLVLATAVVAGGLLFSGAVTTQATQAPKMSLDMDPSGNGVSTNPDPFFQIMTVGDIDRCFTFNGTINPGPFPPPPTFSTHLIVEDVEDLVGWQARFNYDGTKIGISSFNATPFTSEFDSAPIGFTNLPFDTSAHRVVTSAQGGPFFPGTDKETSVIGASSVPANDTFPVSPDTPSKTTHDESTRTYDAPSGGVLAEVIWTIKTGADGDPSVLLDLDDDTRDSPGDNGPGSQVVFFTGSGTDTNNLAESALFDGFLGVNTECVAPPLPTATPTATAVPPGEATPTSTPKSMAPAATQTPVPTPTVLAITQLPDTGGEGGNGGSPAWIYFLAAGLAISAAGAFIAQQLRSRERSQRG